MKIEKKKRAAGGSVTGTKAPMRLDRARGGRTNKSKPTTVNVVVAPQGGAGGPMPMPPPLPPPMPMAPPPAAPDAAGMGNAPGVPNMPGAIPGMYRGGAVKGGAGGALGRLQKARAYGNRARD